MIPAEASQFTATRTKNDIKISWRLALRYFPEFCRDSRNKYVVNIVSCVYNVIRYVVLTAHKLKLGLGYKTYTIYT